MVCVDELGPLNLRSRKGTAWRPTGSPPRSRATRNRRHGVVHVLAALDPTTGKIRCRKWHGEFLERLSSLRARWPSRRLHLVMRNSSPHRHPDVRDWTAADDVESVFLPTRSACLNGSRPEVTALRRFALNGTHHRGHVERNAAVDSPIRTWTGHRSRLLTQHQLRR
ncbi:transposase [Saccharothrix sp. S26]|uniref:transposase n=1 Tax=Saccharothrix sp. S26 TaxID=2907215 RepID=UPI001F44EE9C|nr:transposase [Saccharothrix sp. S26]MCE6993947.1 transposase [Saccharothrix sp. S26]